MSMQKDFEIETVLSKPLMAHLSTTDNGEPRDSPVWFLWEDQCFWIFGIEKDSFIRRLRQDPACAVGVVDFDLEKGILRHVGIRGIAQTGNVDEERLNRFVSKYLGDDKEKWNTWFFENIVDPLDVMVQVQPKTIVAKDVSFFKAGPGACSMKIAIIGLPGSGKSTLAIELGKILNIPVHHLDLHMFEPAGKKKDKEEFILIQKEMINEDSWVIEGCGLSTLEMRFAEADMVLYLQFSRFLCIWRVLKRAFGFGRTSETGCLNGVNWLLLKYIWTFEKAKGPAIGDLKRRYPNADFSVFRSPKEVREYVREIVHITDRPCN